MGGCFVILMIPLMLLLNAIVLLQAAVFSPALILFILSTALLIAAIAALLHGVWKKYHGEVEESIWSLSKPAVLFLVGSAVAFIAALIVTWFVYEGLLVNASAGL